MSTSRRLLPAFVAIALAACGTVPTTGGPTGTSSLRVSPSATIVAPSPSPSENLPDRRLVEVAAFGTEKGIETVLDVADTPFGLIAVGEQYGGTVLQPFGSVPNQARIWQSDDGREWGDVTPEGLGAASLRSVVALPDGSVVAFGSVTGEDEGGMPMLEPRTWMTQDGKAWDPTPVLVEGNPVIDVVSGSQGHMVLVRDGSGRTAIWHASQLWDVQRVLALSFDGAWGSIAAGPEGFVAVRMTPNADGLASTILASGDGIEWVEAGLAPSDVRFAASIGPDWVAVGAGPFEDRSQSTTTPSWFSADGLEWGRTGELALESVGSGADACREYVSGLISAGDVLIVSTVLSYPCGEGGVVRFGRSSLTSDGSSWDVLPLAGRIEADSRGATVNAVLAIEDSLLLVGERDFQAVFWQLD